MGEFTSISVSDGTEMRVYVARPASTAKTPAILVFQEAFGVNSHIRDVTERFAKRGYVAASPELFHRTAPGFEGRYDDFDSVRKHMSAMTNEGIEADVRATYETLRGASRVVSVGFCMGGRVSYIANSILPLNAAASFYGGGIAPALLDRAARQNGPILFFWGGLDKHIGEDQRGAVRTSMTNASKPFIETLFSFADHGFFCDQRASYNPEAARDAWALTTSFLDAHAENSERSEESTEAPRKR
jgi:carboxymethylenebutenolidase